MTRLRAAAAVVGVTLGLTAVTACSDEASDADPATVTAELQPRLDAAKQVLDDAASIDISLSSDELPDGTVGLVSATGTGTHDPAFQGQVVVRPGSGDVDVDVIAVEGQVYAKISFSPVYAPLDPADYGAPDPAKLFDSEDGVATFLAGTENLAEGDQVRDGADVLTTITGTLPGTAVSTLIPSAEQSADFDVDYTLSEDNVLRTAHITGPFYPGGQEVTYDLSLTASDESVSISKP